MKVPPTVDRAARVLIHLVGKGPKGSATLEEIAKSQGISRAALVPVVNRLKKGGILRARATQEGRERLELKRPAERIHLGMVLRALGSDASWNLRLTASNGGSTEPGREGLAAWKEVEKLMFEAMESYTLDHFAWDTLFYL